MKVFLPVVGMALRTSVTTGASFIDSLKPISGNPDLYRVKPVRMIHAKAEMAAPKWVDSFGSFMAMTSKTSSSLRSILCYHRVTGGCTREPAS
ncbi:unnamed protein product [Phytophthora lilii]|uniref:Unnamed protein product n=1 Tax=Phytophthora lilii TaxID=2077276 RepID=A0A9W7D854_9STRA|nr:unnamed protein product [Phytophthora lilii]